MCFYISVSGTDTGVEPISRVHLPVHLKNNFEAVRIEENSVLALAQCIIHEYKENTSIDRKIHLAGQHI